MTHDAHFKILAVDGGGTRGVYPAQVLARIEDATGQPVRDCFDLLAGTSTGAIVVGAAAAGIEMKSVVTLFERHAPVIFPKPRIPALLSAAFRSKYSRGPLERVLKMYLPERTLGELTTPLMITSADIATGGVHVFKSRYLRDLGETYERDGNVLLKDAILASCAAPIYFDPKAVGPYLLADGGLWANNPSLIALTEAVAKFKKEVNNIRILSLGTGHTPRMYSPRGRWGLLTGWSGLKLVAYTLELQSQASSNMTRLLLGGRFLRLDPEIDKWELDDTTHLPILKALADKHFTYQSKAIFDHIERKEP